MKTIKGDLIKLAKDGMFSVIGHGANIRCIMGAGIAKQIKFKFPEAFHADLATGTHLGKLGHITSALVQRSNNPPLVVINMYTQPDLGDCFDIRAFHLACIQVVEIYGRRNHKFGFPMIGCGIGGGNKNEVIEVFKSIFEGEEITLVEYERESSGKKM